MRIGLGYSAVFCTRTFQAVCGEGGEGLVGTARMSVEGAPDALESFFSNPASCAIRFLHACTLGLPRWTVVDSTTGTLRAAYGV